MTTFRDHIFLGLTQSLCPDCLRVIPAKIITQNDRVYFKKTCPLHGTRQDFVCSDRSWFDRLESSVPGKVPPRMAVSPRLGCPYDCGLCSEHEQHTCVAVLEITGNCNLECPMCYASSAPGGTHLSVSDCVAAMDHLIRAEGRPEVLQLSGGEPTIHPEFFTILDEACTRPIDMVMINTNGVRIARDADFRERLASYRKRCEIYLQFDGFKDENYLPLRGVGLAETKFRAVESLGEVGLNTILVCTVQPDVNELQIGPIVDFGSARPWVTGVNFQPATYVGRCVTPADLERRTTFPDILRELERQSVNWAVEDFLPLPCAHPNAHTIAYAYRRDGKITPVARFIDIADHIDLLANGILFTREKAKALIQDFLTRSSCGDDCGCHGTSPDWMPPVHGQSRPSSRLSTVSTTDIKSSGVDFFERALKEELQPRDVFRVTTTSFMDAYNFDLRQLMKSCVHFVLPSGHLIPFSAYNVLYRDGHVTLPTLNRDIQAVGVAEGRV